MKTVILAGGFGTRISEESKLRPKPMIEIGERPILWHIMKLFSAYGLNDFIICLGYKGYSIKEYFAHYYLQESDVTFDFREGNLRITHQHSAEPWRVTLVDTGMETMTGGRLRRVRPYLDEDTFCFTYGDGISDIELPRLIDFHRQQQALVTLTAVQPPGRFGAFSLGGEQNKILHFREKPQGDGAWVNGGFFVVEPGAIDYIDSDATVWEREPLERLAQDGQLAAYRHHGFWQPMDTLRDKMLLEELWRRPQPPWKVW